MRKTLLWFWFLVPTLWAAGTDTSLWRYIHPKSKALVGIQWSTVQPSAVGQWIRRRWINEENIPGVEFLPDIKEVLISSPGPANANEDAPLLIAIRGQFDLTGIQQLLGKEGHRAQTFGGVSIYGPPARASAEPAFALLDPQTILVGDLQSLYATVERSRLPLADQDQDGLLARAQLLATHYDCWALMTEPGAMKNFLFASLAGPISTESLSFEVGISVKDGLSIDVVLTSRTDRAARISYAKLTRILKLAAQDHANPEYAALFQKLHVSADRSNLFISLKMNPQETAASLNVQPVAKPRAAEAARISDPPADKVIRIEGLDEGVREVLVQHPR